MQEQYIKEKVKERYGKIALTGSSDCCCVPGECCGDGSNNSNGRSVIESTKLIGYDSEDIASIPKTSVLGVGCGVPPNFADIKEGEIVVDLGAGAGIDVFLSANKVGKSGKVIGIDMTDEMLEKARKNAKDNGYTNVEFRKGDIENSIPVENSAVDLVISNCVINLTIDKVSTFKEIYRILKNDGGRTVISDLVTDKDIDKDSLDVDKWCSCIDGALTKKNYLDSIRKAGFKNVEVLRKSIHRRTRR
jgi:arsenite methyltransferase